MHVGRTRACRVVARILHPHPPVFPVIDLWVPSQDRCKLTTWRANLSRRPRVVLRPLGWSPAKLRYASFILLGAAAPAAIGIESSSSAVRWLCLAWLLGVAVLVHGVSRRAAAETTVLSIDQRGVWDRRLTSRHIEWREIELVCPVDCERSHVVDLELRRPEIALAGTRWRVRIGAHCQRGFWGPGGHHLDVAARGHCWRAAGRRGAVPAGTAASSQSEIVASTILSD